MAVQKKTQQPAALVNDHVADALAAQERWERETRGEQWTSKVLLAKAVFALLWAILWEVRSLRTKGE